MAQHDYSIANQTAANARTDINNALSAVVSNNSGATAPTTTYANMWWYDTDSNTLKIRNEANTAWITVGEINQIANTFSGGMPAGAVQAFAMSTPPSGWLKCNGQEVSRTEYAALFGAIGTIYGSGNGSTTFNLPDLRGEFVRGWDDSRGVDYGRTIGSTQTDTFQEHYHEIRNNVDGYITQPSGGDIGYSGPTGARSPDQPYEKRMVAKDAAEAPDAGTPRTSTETRPRNVAMTYCIKH